MAKPEWFFGDIRYQHFERDNITISESAISLIRKSFGT